MMLDYLKGHGKVAPEMVNRIGFLEINNVVQHYHLNTALGNGVVNHFKRTPPVRLDDSQGPASDISS